MHKDISKNYNELQSSADLMKSEKARLSKNLIVAEATLSTKEAELKRVESKVEYYEDKSTSIGLFTTVKVHAEMLKEYYEGKTSSWDPKVA